MKICTLILSWIFVSSVIAQETKYPGAWRNLEETAQEAEGVCIAEFVNLGWADVGSPGASFYSDAVLKISRGLVPGKFSTMGCTYSVQIVPTSSNEKAPVLGKTYLMIGGFGGGKFAIKKMVEPTPANVALVEQVLRARGIEIGPDIKPPLDGNGGDNTNHQPVQTDVASPVGQAANATPTGEESPSPALWTLIVVLIMAALGLLWSLLKRRSRA